MRALGDAGKKIAYTQRVNEIKFKERNFLCSKEFILERKEPIVEDTDGSPLVC